MSGTKVDIVLDAYLFSSKLSRKGKRYASPLVGRIETVVHGLWYYMLIRTYFGRNALRCGASYFRSSGTRVFQTFSTTISYPFAVGWIPSP